MWVDYEKQILEDEARIIRGLGDGGEAALTGLDNVFGEASEKKYGVNVYLSDRIAYNRSLKDHRNPECNRVPYDIELPSTSVILIFHNEPYSVVIRAIWSIINSARRDQPWFERTKYLESKKGKNITLGTKQTTCYISLVSQDPSSPLVYLKEIILVDDSSTLPELKGKLRHYLRTRLPPGLIKLFIPPNRLGLIRARHAAVQIATGDVVIFIDSRCEVHHDWLRPLLQRIKQKRTTVVTPIINNINGTDFSYQSRDPMTIEVGGFTFSGSFTWVDLPKGENEKRTNISPARSPTMKGDVFAINREFYWDLGAYDEQVVGWDGDHLEMSFRIWQYGGTLEIIPCSVVGRVHSTKHHADPADADDSHGINIARMAKIWMDQYAELFYLHRPDLRNNPIIGDITDRKALREGLACKSFRWYLYTIYKEKFVPVRDVIGYGRFKNEKTDLCLDTSTLLRDDAASGVPLGVDLCYGQLKPTQYLSLTLNGRLRNELYCAHLQINASMKDQRILMSTCRHKQNRDIWVYLQSKQLLHVASRLCMDSGFNSGADVLAKPCNFLSGTQKWIIDYTEQNDFRSADHIIPRGIENTLRMLRGPR